jgi:hypothetical protein
MRMEGNGTSRSRSETIGVGDWPVSQGINSSLPALDDQKDQAAG